MNWSLAGQVTTVAIVWIILAALASPLVGRFMKKRKLAKQPRYAMPVRVVLTEQQEALVREQSEFNARHDNAYLERARRAESLGFIDPEDAA